MFKELGEQHYLAHLDKNVIKPKKSSSTDIQPFDEEKISSEKRRLAINNFLIRINDVLKVNTYKNQQEQDTALAEILNEAKLKLGQPLGEACQAFKGKCSIDPFEFIRGACTVQQESIVILFGEAQFDFNANTSSDFGLIYSTIIGEWNSHELRNILINFGTKLDQFYSNYDNIIREKIMSFDTQYHIASLGCIITDNQYDRLPRASRQAYSAGQQFGDDYRNTIKRSLEDIFQPIPISIIVIDYLGKSFSIPEKKFDNIQEKSGHLTADYSKFFQANEDKRKAREINKLAQKFEDWIQKKMHADLLQWVLDTGSVQSYQKFCKLALRLSQKGYNLKPPPSEEDFNRAILDFSCENVDWHTDWDWMDLS